MKLVSGFGSLIVLILSACAVPTPAPTAIPYSTTEVSSVEGYPLDTTTGNPEIDPVLAAVASGDPEELHALIDYTSAPCTTADGLGGPPKCREGEAEGTMLEVLPSISSEGGHIRKEEISSWQGVDASALYAIYKVADTALNEEYYPPGEYIIFYVPKENEPGIALHIADGGIVRVDTMFDVFPESLSSVIERDTSEVILPPR